jgi:hypothetical protein
MSEISWKPVHFLNNVSASVGSVIKPAGYENSQDIISAAYLKDPSDPQWNNDPGMKEFYAFLEKDFPEGNKLDGSVVPGRGAAYFTLRRGAGTWLPETRLSPQHRCGGFLLPETDG